MDGGGDTPEATPSRPLEQRRTSGGSSLRSGFTPASRGQLFRRFQGLAVADCPFANLPGATGGRWGQGLTAEKMTECRWLMPSLVGEFEFVEWTPDNHLRHVRFAGLREDKAGRNVIRQR